MVNKADQSTPGAPPSARRLYTKAEVEAAITRMAHEINEDYADKTPPVLLGVMTGAVPFLGELILQLGFALEIDYVHVSRYRGQTQGGQLNWLAEPRTPLAGRPVLIIDDILDEGHTLRELVTYCETKGAASIEVAVLVDKPNPRRVQGLEAHYVGLLVPDVYVFGYGMDYESYWRNLPGIYALEEDVRCET